MIDEVLEIWDRVKDWPEEKQRSLISKINDSLAERRQSRPKKNLAELVGLIPWNGPPPTDAEVERILYEERMKKYGH